MNFSTEEILKRLEVLRKKLEDEGLYVSANTAGLAMDEIARLAALSKPDAKAVPTPSIP